MRELFSNKVQDAMKGERGKLLNIGDAADLLAPGPVEPIVVVLDGCPVSYI